MGNHRWGHCPVGEASGSWVREGRGDGVKLDDVEAGLGGGQTRPSTGRRPWRERSTVDA
jgi:hypothetical protein